MSVLKFQGLRLHFFLNFYGETKKGDRLPGRPRQASTERLDHRITDEKPNVTGEEYQFLHTTGEPRYQRP